MGRTVCAPMRIFSCLRIGADTSKGIPSLPPEFRHKQYVALRGYFLQYLDPQRVHGLASEDAQVCRSNASNTFDTVVRRSPKAGRLDCIPRSVQRAGRFSGPDSPDFGQHKLATTDQNHEWRHIDFQECVRPCPATWTQEPGRNSSSVWQIHSVHGTFLPRGR